MIGRKMKPGAKLPSSWDVSDYRQQPYGSKCLRKTEGFASGRGKNLKVRNLRGGRPRDTI